MGSSVVLLGDQLPVPSQQGLRRDNAGNLGKTLSSQRLGFYGQSPALIVIEAHSPDTQLFSKHPILLAKIMTCSCRWFIHPETAISKNRKGSSTLWVFKTHYRDRRAAVAKYRIFMQIQFSAIRGPTGL